jgi:hypothetical protein
MTRPILSLLVLLFALAPACGENKVVVRPDQPPAPPMVERQGVGPRLVLQVEQGRYVAGAEISSDPGYRSLALHRDLGPGIRDDVARLWPTPATDGAPWLARVIVEKVEAGWPAGFGIDVTAHAALRLVLVPAAAPKADPAYEKVYDGFATEGFFGAGTVEDGWKRVVDKACTEAILRLLGDEGALAMLAGDPPGYVAPGKASPSPAAAAAVIVAVFDLSDPAKQLDEGTRGQLIGYLSTALVQTGRFKVIPRDQLRARLLDEKKESYRECFDEACQLELGKALAAEKSLTVQLLKVGKSCAVTANLYDLKTETADRGGLVNTGCSTDELLGAMAELARQLAGN